jgi:hypothetical protein
MPTRITPLDAKAFAIHEIYRKGEQIYESGLVKHRFQTNYGLHGTVRSKGVYRVEMIVDGDQLFGRCTCHAGSSPCEHQVAMLLAWLNEPTSFLSYQALRKSIREKEKNTLIDLLVNLVEVIPELSQFFVIGPGIDEADSLREEVADIFDFPHTQKIDPQEITQSCQIILVHAKLLRSEGKWEQARILLFEILNRTLALVDRQQTIRPFRESFITEIGDDYEELALSDPDYQEHEPDIKREIEELLAHESAEVEGVFLEQLRPRLKVK